MLRLTTLGTSDLRDRLGRPVREVLAQPKRVALLVYLAVESRRGPVSRDRVLAMFWPESDDTRARNALSQSLHHLRQVLGAGVIESQGSTTLSAPPGELWCDARVFAEAVERGEAELALDLYRGEFCPTLFVSGAPQVEEWLDEQRRQLRRQALATARTLAERLDAEGDTEAAARIARRALALRPDDESDVRVHLALLERAGDVTGALVAYDEFARRLADDLEVEPAPETRSLVRDMRARRERATAARRDADDRATGAPDGPAGAGAELSAGPTASPRVEPSRRPARRLFAAVAVAAVLLTVGALTVRARNSAGRGPPTSGRAIAIFPFAVHGGEGIAYLHDGLADLLAAKLDGTADLHAIDRRSVVAAVAAGSPGTIDYGRIAAQLGARWYVLGDVTEAAGRLQVDGSLFQVGRAGPAAARASVTGDTTALFQLVDDLSGRMLAGLLVGRDTALTRLAAATTSSLPALKAYLRGEEAMRAGHDAQAAAAFREAAQIDTTFALALYRLALMSTWVTIPGVDVPGEWAARAARHDRKLSPLGRDLLTAYRTYKEPDSRAEDMYRAITQSHPDNVEAWFMLGESLFHYNPFKGRSPQEALPAFERALALDPGNAHAMLHVARLAAADGRVGTLDSISGRFLARYTDTERTLEIRALRAWVHRDRAGAAAVVREATTFDVLVVHSLLQSAATLVQDLDAATTLAGPLIQATQATWLRMSAVQMVGSFALASGNWDTSPTRALADGTFDRDWLLETEALAASEPLFAVPQDRIARLREQLTGRRSFPAAYPPGLPAPDALGGAMRVYLIGLLSVRLGDGGEASRRESELRMMAGAGGPAADLARQMGAGLRAERARTAGRFEQALTELNGVRFELTVPRLAHQGVRERFLRAEVLHALGRDDEALAWYDSFQSLYDLPFAALARLRQAQIHERAGRRERAAFNYGRFLGLWGNADAEFQPMVRQAREALARLEARPAS